MPSNTKMPLAAITFSRDVSQKIGSKHKTPTTNGAVAANPLGDGAQHSFSSYGTWHGICGSNGMEWFTLPRTLKYYIAWQRSTMKFAPNSSRVMTGYNKETIAFSLGR